MSEHRWTRIDHLVQAALERPEPEREAFIREACGSNTGLRDEVLSLVAYGESAERFLKSAHPAGGRIVEPGGQVGPYQVEALIGAGGMGEVYRALDPRLGRRVALKILPPGWADDSDRLRRFQQEARAIAALNDPHICTLHDIGEENGTRFLVMELVEGETLADRLARGPMPLDQVLRQASEIASALDRAHRKGIIHRDLKPGNVMLTKDGTKLLDFGVSKLREPGAGEPVNAAGVQTVEGTLIGTLPYMAPEQIECGATDARTDLWALGCVLYEMLTGRRPFDSATQATLIAAILEREPDAPASLQPDLPPVVDYLVRKCLAKNPDERWQSAADIAHQLRWIADHVRQPTGTASGVPISRRRSPARWIAGAVAVGLVAALAVWALTLRSSSREAPEKVQFDIQLPESVSAINGLSVSPDGLRVSYVDEDQLWVHDLTTNLARPVKGAKVDLLSFPFWSPDGRWIAYFFDSRLKKVPAAGGIPQDICAARLARGGSWSANGTIVFSVREEGVFRVSDSGGTPVRVTTIDKAKGEVSHLWPHFVDEDRFTYATFGLDVASRLASLDSRDPGRPIPLLENSEVYVAAGFMLTVVEDTLTAQRVSSPRMEVIGEATPIARPIAQPPTNFASHNAFAASDTTLVYSIRTSRRFRFAIVDHQGRSVQAIGQPAAIERWALATDGTKLAFTLADGEVGAGRIWQLDLSDGRVTPLTSSVAFARMPIWSPRGDQIAFVRVDARGQNLHVKRLGTEAEVLVGESSAWQKVPFAWHLDGTLLFGMPARPGQMQNIWRVSTAGGKPEIWFPSEVPAGLAQFSPDGRFAAYYLQDQIWVKPYPNAGAPAVSVADGWLARWRPDGTALFYLHSDSLMEVPVEFDRRVKPGSVKAGSPRKVFSRSGFAEDQGNLFAVLPDGKRFVVTEPVGPAPRPTITVVRNWATALERK